MRPTSAVVSLANIVHNYQLACRLAPASRNVAVIKANAYGHGVVKVAQALQDLVPAFGVASIDEAVQLWDAGIRKPVLILQGVNRAGDIAEVTARGFWLMLHHRQQLEHVLTSKPVSPIKAWLKVDTGMHRFGFIPESLDQVFTDLNASDNFEQNPVLCTHLACADDLANPMTSEQVKVIRACAAKFELTQSIANSAGVLYWPESHADFNRPGYMLYGNCPTGSFEPGTSDLRPAMTMCSEVVTIRSIEAGAGVGYGQDWLASKPSRIGTVAIGYADGYPRHAPSGTPMLINGQRAPLVGRVSMDAITVNLTSLDNVSVGDPVELWGENLSANEVAASAGTIGYETLAGLTGRVPLRYAD